MTVKINGTEMELKYSLRTHILYEGIVGESLDYTQLTNITKITQLFYCNIVATMQAKKHALDFTWNDFLDWLDENGDYKLVNEYALWLTHQLEVQYNLVQQDEDKEETDNSHENHGNDSIKKKLNIKK